MRLNVLGSILLPIDDMRSTDEDRPLCAVMTIGFKRWLDHMGDLHRVQDVEPGERVALAVETWIQSYQHGVSPPILAEYSHERALYWLPLDVFHLATTESKTY